MARLLFNKVCLEVINAVEREWHCPKAVVVIGHVVVDILCLLFQNVVDLCLVDHSELQQLVCNKLRRNFALLPAITLAEVELVLQHAVLGLLVPYLLVLVLLEAVSHFRNIGNWQFIVLPEQYMLAEFVDNEVSGHHREHNCQIER